ncbi:MAG: DNA repair protein RecN [Myxococcales bacterium]|nr:DNA repair protein RecN [Myxococcales bacterium]
MLRRLCIQDLAIVDRLEVEFGPNFSALTGETGAGKSILVNALSLLMGARADPELIRAGSETAEVEGEFLLPEGSPVLERLRQAGLADGRSLRLRRVLAPAGRARAFVNERAVGVASLAELTRGLLDIAGQHQHVALTTEETQLFILDAYGDLLPAREGVARAVAALEEAQRELDELSGRERQRAEREEYLRFTLSRMDALHPAPGEDRELEAARLRLRNTEKLAEGLEQALDALYRGDAAAVELLGRARAALQGIARFDPAFEAQRERLDGILSAVEELSREVERERGRLESDPARLEEVEERLSALRNLMRAHGPTLEDVLAARERMAGELAGLEGLAGRVEVARAERERREAEALNLCRELSSARTRVAADLAGRLQQELRGLAMPAARLEIEVAPLSLPRPTPRGLDRVTFLFSANPGEPLRPLSRVASGGELSRVLLGLKVVLSRVDPVASYVFDEVDAGVGGATAEVLGRTLQRVSDSRQILCVTHLPQIACFAHEHFRVKKEVRQGRARVEVERLEGEARVAEIARMAGGRRVTEAGRAHARELLRSSARPAQG